MCQCQSQSQRYFTTGGLLPISSSWRQGPLRFTTSNFIFQLNACCYSPYVTFSLTRGWVCNLQLLLVLASVDILSSESRGTRFTVLDSRLPTWRARSPYLYRPGTRWPSYKPRHWVPFSSPPTTLRATVEVFDLVSTRDLTCQQSKSTSKFLYDWRFTAIQFVLASSPLRLTTRFFLFQQNSCGNSPYVTSSLTRRWVCLLWICLAFRQVYISHIQHVIENFFLLHYTQVLCQYRLYRTVMREETTPQEQRTQ
jgi:hypothetical protein